MRNLPSHRCFCPDNEKVDVFSFAMCLVELVDGRLPWSGTCSAAEVPHKVTRRIRPEHQLAKADGKLYALIERCWHHDAARRPSFEEIKEELEAAAEEKGLDLEPERSSVAR